MLKLTRMLFLVDNPEYGKCNYIYPPNNTKARKTPRYNIWKQITTKLHPRSHSPSIPGNSISGVMVSVLASSVVNLAIEPQSD